jgi:7-carboxy-7-deazaguanine synthase
MLKINEIFFSIQGESSKVGWPTVFIRTSGCHLRCNYCDTQYAYYEGQALEINKIIEKVKTYPAKHVCLTGGEPLLQKASLELMTQLCDLNYSLSLETSGDLDVSAVDPRVLKVIDIKTPDSGEFGRFSEKNLSSENVNTEFKFVICSEKDFVWAQEYIQKYQLDEKYTILMSPVHGKISAQWLAEKILQTNLNARLQLQLHKYIWSPETRGV